MGFVYLFVSSHLFAREAAVVWPVRVTDCRAACWGLRCASIAAGAGSLAAQEGLASGFLKPGISSAPQDESQLGSPAPSRCAEGREMLSAEPKKYVPGGRLGKWEMGREEEREQFSSALFSKE